ncbi:SLU7 [Branchiostoma lanceolatum]|uniref:Pre-mRNA-splicing factor SLU7 n=1 Tax=Branchiostoma lanceolatum TaxID=7740 RepID=A0A8K0EMV3_BRALA|nr:SLU7 [Branchiostoma lanceolatum]
MASEQTTEEQSEQKISKREDWKKKKELEEARKAGTAPAEVDEEGKDINPHIPQYIASAPWYYYGRDGEKLPTLKHQRPQPEKQLSFSDPDKWFKRGVKTGPVATKFRKGACGNCGSMTHKKKDCFERPRKVGAKFTGDKIAPDEHMQPDLAFDYDGKRDRWNGFNPQEYQAVIDEYSKVEMAKRQLKEQKMTEDLLAGKIRRDEDLEEDSMRREGDSDEEDDEDKYADNIDMAGQKFDSKRRITVRNLRIREDTAKYLLNLDPNSAYYDPKTRSMRENPYMNKHLEEVSYAGDNFVRQTGDTVKMAQEQLFAWEASGKGTDVHLQADPTKLELLHKEFKVKKDDYKQNQKGSILERYGGAEHLEAPPKQLLLAQTEDYVEYSRHGTVLKGQEKAVTKSKYEEDVLINNHTAIWGSYWREGRWGYRCCHSFVKMSYCTGEAGKQVARMEMADMEIRTFGDEDEEEEEAPKSLLEQHQEELKKNKKKKKKERQEAEEKEQKDKEKKLKKALKAEEERNQTYQEIMKLDERKRPYNSLAADNQEVTEEELEAFRIKRANYDDPMKNMLGK